MRLPLSSRLVVGTVGLALAAVTFGPVPAQAHTPGPESITRAQVVAVAQMVRTGTLPAVAGSREVRSMINRACRVDPDTEVITQTGTAASPSGGSAEVLLVAGKIQDVTKDPGDATRERNCFFGVAAASRAGDTLSGSASINVTSTRRATVRLSGEVGVTPRVYLTAAELREPGYTPHATASGATITDTTARVPDRKSAKQKKRAKKAYVRAVAKARASYLQGMKKAATPAKKKVVTGTFVAKKKAAKKRLKLATAPYRVVVTTVRTPFVLTASPT